MMGTRKQKFVFGVDGGGTASTCLVCDLSGHVLARIQGGALNFHPQHVGLQRATENLNGLLMKAFTSVNCNPDQIEHICLAISGVDRKEDAKLVRSQFDKLFPCQAETRICNDRELLGQAPPDSLQVWLLSAVPGVPHSDLMENCTPV